MQDSSTEDILDPFQIAFLDAFFSLTDRLIPFDLATVQEHMKEKIERLTKESFPR